MNKTLILCIASALAASTLTFLAMQEPSKTEGDFFVSSPSTSKGKNTLYKKDKTFAQWRSIRECWSLVMGPHKYNEGYAMAGLPLPGRPDERKVSEICENAQYTLRRMVSSHPAVTCTYMQSGPLTGEYVPQNTRNWRLVEFQHGTGLPNAVFVTAVPRPTQQQVRKCESETNFRQLITRTL